MPEPIKWRSKVILFKTEVTYGTDPTPSGAANAILATNVTLQPMEGEDVSRNLERPFLGNQGTLAAGLRVVLSFSTELAGSGAAGTAPLWGPLARACGLAEVIDAGVSVTYSPITDGHEAVTGWIYIGNTRHKLTGGRGTGVLTVNAQGIPMIAWTLTGLWNAPGESAQATPDLTDWLAPVIATNANTPVFTVGAVSLVMRSFQLDLGNQVEPRLLIGREDIRIVDRAEQITTQVEAVPLTTLDPFALAQAKTPVAVALTHGTAAGSITAISAPICEVARPSGYQNEQGVAEWQLSLSPLPDEGNDQFSITLT